MHSMVKRLHMLIGILCLIKVDVEFSAVKLNSLSSSYISHSFSLSSAVLKSPVVLQKQYMRLLHY